VDIRNRYLTTSASANPDGAQLDGARTSLFVPDLDRLFVAARAGFFGIGSDAAILVVHPAGFQP
jgi:hypothetical protein